MIARKGSIARSPSQARDNEVGLVGLVEPVEKSKRDWRETICQL